MDDGRRGEAALSASRYDEAIEHFTKAISANSSAVRFYINRSTAYQRSSRYNEALADAEIAVFLANNRGSRELINNAQFRRALALFFLEKYGDAEYLFGIVKELDPKNKMLPVWNMKLAAKLKDIPEDDEKRKVTVNKVPDVEIPDITVSDTTKESDNVAASRVDTPASTPKPVVPTPANKIKVDWYQSNDSVTINILAKGVPKDAATVEFEKDTVSIAFPITGSSDYSYLLDPLYAPIDPAESKYRITPNKVEVTLRKKMSGAKWHTLEGASEFKSADATESMPTLEPVTGKSNQESAPAYPTSSKHGAKNWDKVAEDGYDEENEIEGDECGHFFKTLFKKGTAEQQKAMMKSYQESGGTVLSTDWDNVSRKTVLPEPPEGMEAKSYN
ncbi:Cochaperone protein [Neocucurbitaria cava]|uniref:Cochaperone protein n=1 Tax=Neocucurbitaria cava TaxID=798079 RepID=A0A9W9CR02_9PLEO|nr:Cochaperone protein [Neocucurbitaria cava]